ncbi:hypothetical protein BU15DRAFT_25346, partial [Melanogaster broomeanus]
TGARNARVLGWAKAYCKNLDRATQVMHDQEVIGATSMAWGLIKSVVPSEITDHILKRLEEEGLPSLATRNIDEGPGFALTLDGCTYTFPQAERAPPETYLARGYVS